MRKLNHYRRSDVRRSILEIAVTALPFALAWGAMLLALKLDQVWLYGLLLLPTAGLLVRLFMIQHDCGHGSFFSNKSSNDWTGRVIGVLTLTPYDHWKRSHAIHHASSGNLDHRGIGDIETLTVREYRALSRLGKAPLSAVSQSIGHVRHWSDLYLPAAKPPAARRVPQRLDALGQHHGDQSGRRAHRRGAHLCGGLLVVRAGAPADRVRRRARRESGCSTSSISSRGRTGPETRAGASTRRRCTAARTTTCRRCCGGSPPISACTMCTICAAASPITACRKCCATTRAP